MFLLYFFILLCTHLSQEAKPNVLLIIVDDLRPFLGAYGYENAFTPNIDRLAKKSIVFNKAYVQVSIVAICTEWGIYFSIFSKRFALRVEIHF